MTVLPALCKRLALGLALTFAISLPAQADYLFRIHGSNTVGAKLAPSAAIAFMENRGYGQVRRIGTDVENEFEVVGYDPSSRQEHKIFIAAHGSSTGFKSMDAGDADIAMSSRRVKEKEVERLRRFGNLRDDGNEHIIAIDGLAIVVHPSNTIDELNTQQLAKIFAGEITHWDEIGGPSRAINLYARDNKSGTWDTFKSLVLGKKFKLDKRAQRFESNDLLSDSVAADKGGIGFVGIASVRDAKLLAIASPGSGAILPSQTTVATEDYPLTRRLHMYTKRNESNPDLKDYIQFVLAQAGQDVVRETGFISQNLQTFVMDTSEMPSSYQAITDSAVRLSLNFRFQPGSARLDNKAKKDLLRLADYLSLAEHQNKAVVLIGFGDQKKRDSLSMVLSKLRAMAVKNALRRKIDQLIAPVQGLGDQAPVASNDDKKQRLKNRRVEVWLK